MRPGVAVTYMVRGTAYPATVTAVVGSGASGYKRLDLSYGDEQATDVPHVTDATEGQARWTLVAPVSLEAPKRRRRITPAFTPPEEPQD